MSDASFARLLRTLQVIPAHPRSLDTTQIAALLAADGFDTTARTVQRDLVKLESLGLGIECVDDSKPFRWRLSATAKPNLVTGLDVPQALALLLVEAHLSRLVPRAVWASLKGTLDAARKVVEGKPARRWIERVRVVPRAQPLAPPNIDVTVLDAVQVAIVEERTLEVTYKKDDGTKDVTLHPRGLIFRDATAYLVATTFEYDDIRHYALHRMKKAVPGEARARKAPAGFDLDTHVAAGEAGWRLAKEPVALELAFYDGAERSVAETPLSTDQTMKRVNEATIVKATVTDTRVLRSWLLGFGPAVEVRKPKALRDDMRAMLQATRDRYDD